MPWHTEWHTKTGQKPKSPSESITWAFYLARVSYEPPCHIRLSGQFVTFVPPNEPRKTEPAHTTARNWPVRHPLRFPCWYFGSASSGSLSHFLTVLRARPVRLAISLIDLPSRKRSVLIFVLILMVITLEPRPKSRQGRLNTLVNLQSALRFLDDRNSSARTINANELSITLQWLHECVHTTEDPASIGLASTFWHHDHAGLAGCLPQGNAV